MKIMFVMLKTLGDVLLGTTICRELKKKFPESEIHFYVNHPYNELLENNPDIYQIHAAKEWHYNMLFIEMAENKWDKIYAPYQTRFECNMWHQQEQYRYQHLLDFYWSRMGFHEFIEERECYLFPSEENLKESNNFISLDVPRIAIHSTSGVVTKDWPYFNELVEEYRKEGYACIQVGGMNDKLIKNAIDFRAKMSFLTLAAFLSKCALFIGLDSGLSYIADTMKTPTIVIQGSTNPVTSGPISKRVNHLFVEKTGYPDCEIIRCHANCRHEINCNTKITVDMVLNTSWSILDKLEIPISTKVI